MRYEIKNFGTLPDGTLVDLIQLSNAKMQLSLCPYGACITSILTPDKNGSLGEIVLGFDGLEDYLHEHPYYGTIVGPVANRISNASFKIGDEIYHLDKNEDPNHLHGGFNAFDKKLWDYEIHRSDDSIEVRMMARFRDGEGCYPGNRNCTVSFMLHTDSRLDIHYRMTSDKSTVVNLTHHEYWNLKDGGASQALDHRVQLFASAYTPVREDGCVTGEIRDVSGSRFDLRESTLLSDRIDSSDRSTAYDHNFVLDGSHSKALKKAATLSHPATGRVLEIWTDQSCVQFYCSQFMDGSLGRGQEKYHAFHGICLETQDHPDAPNQASFPDIYLNPREIYEQTCRYIFKLTEDE